MLAGRAKPSVMCAEQRIIRQCREMVSEVVAPIRARTGSTKAAQHDAARILALTPRRVRAYMQGEVRNVPAWEAQRISETAERMRDLRIQTLEAEIARLRAARGSTRQPD